MSGTDLLRGGAWGVIVCSLAAAVVSLLAPQPLSRIAPLVAEAVAVPEPLTEPAPESGAAVAALPAGPVLPPRPEALASETLPLPPDRPAVAGDSAARPQVEDRALAPASVAASGRQPILGSPPDPVLPPPPTVEPGGTVPDRPPLAAEAPPAQPGPEPAALAELAAGLEEPDGAAPAPDVSRSDRSATPALPDPVAALVPPSPDADLPGAWNVPPVPAPDPLLYPAGADAKAVAAAPPPAPARPAEAPAPSGAPSPPLLVATSPEQPPAADPPPPVQAAANPDQADAAAVAGEEPAPVPGQPPSAPATPERLAQAEPPQEPLRPAPQTEAPAVRTMPGKRVGRLPTVGSAVAPDAPAVPAEPPAPEPPAAADPIARYARPFDNPGGLPMIAVVLFDTGDAYDPAALAALDIPVSIAVDPLRPDAAAAMARYRALGQEVLVAAPLPVGAAASDAAVALAGYLSAMPETVAAIEAEPGGLQPDRQVAAQVVADLAASGRGLVAFDSGLNPARQLAQREGLPFAEVFRDIDGAGQDAAAVRRFVDQAAFRAGQEGRVVLVGRLRPETLAALADWRDAPRAATVALAPVSAVLAVP